MNVNFSRECDHAINSRATRQRCLGGVLSRCFGGVFCGVFSGGRSPLRELPRRITSRFAGDAAASSVLFFFPLASRTAAGFTPAGAGAAVLPGGGRSASAYEEPPWRGPRLTRRRCECISLYEISPLPSLSHACETTRTDAE